MIVTSLLVLGVIAAVSAIILYVVARKFAVQENPLIDQIAEVLPGANCGGCGYAGCRAFAENCAKGVATFLDFANFFKCFFM